MKVAAKLSSIEESLKKIIDEEVGIFMTVVSINIVLSSEESE